jgi:hypothetical protein
MEFLLVRAFQGKEKKTTTKKTPNHGCGVKKAGRWIDPDNIKELISELIPELSGSGRLSVSHK